MKWQYLDGVQSPNPAAARLPGGDAVQAVEVVHAEVASRVRDQPLVPQADRLRRMTTGRPAPTSSARSCG